MDNNNKCLKCGEALKKRDNEFPYLFKKRKYCNSTCFRKDIGRKNKPTSTAGRKNMSKGQLGRKHTERSKESIERYSKANMGDKNPNWKGGASRISITIRGLYKYRQWRSDVFTRDGFTCQNCGQIGGKLNSHHIKQLALIVSDNNITNSIEANECEELWNINNGLTLCVECHKKTDGFATNI